RSVELSLPLGARDVPNVYLSAILVRSGQLYQDTAQLFVPPARRFASVTVRADRERFQPGEKATFRLQARDWRGRPLRAELSLAVTDDALAAIQDAATEEIRTHFYGDTRAQSIEASASPQVTFSAL